MCDITDLAKVALPVKQRQNTTGESSMKRLVFLAISKGKNKTTTLVNQLPLKQQDIDQRNKQQAPEREITRRFHSIGVK